MNLEISSITMVDLTNKEAKKISFAPGKNFITSERNHQGKTVIMKSIYYTLGAEVYYSRTIKNINLLTYIDFTLDDHSYRIARLKNSFTVYCDNHFVKLFTSVGSFEDELSKLFALEINLVGKDQEKTIVKCPPAFYYMPYYIDQENGWAANSFSFDRMTQFDLPQRKSSYFFHLGVLDSEYVEISRRHKANDKQVSLLVKENEKYLTVADTLQSGLDDALMSFDSSSLESAISLRQEEITKILNGLSKVRKRLVEAEDQLTQLIHEKKILSKYIKKKLPATESEIDDAVECPRCGMVFEQHLKRQLEKAYLLETLHDDYTTLSNKQIFLERHVAVLIKKLNSIQSKLRAYEKSLDADRGIYDTYVKSKATNQLLREYHERIGKNKAEIERLQKDTKAIRQLIKGYEDERTQANIQYLTNLNELLAGLDVPASQIEDNSEPGSAIIASGAYGPRCKISQILAFVETQHVIASDMISFPIVIDSPNVLEQDNEHLDTVIHTLLTWNKTNNQIIIASIKGKDTALKIPDVNIITLANPQDHLLSAEEYATYETEIAEIFTRF